VQELHEKIAQRAHDVTAVTFLAARNFLISEQKRIYCPKKENW